MNDTAAQLPAEPRNPLADATREFEILQDQNATLTRERDEAVQLNSRMAAEVDEKNRSIKVLEQTVRELNNKIRMLQGYSAGIVTRMNVAIEVMLQAQKDVAEQAVEIAAGQAAPAPTAKKVVPSEVPWRKTLTESLKQ